MKSLFFAILFSVTFTAWAVAARVYYRDVEDRLIRERKARKKM